MTIVRDVGDWQIQCRVEMRTQVRNLDRGSREPELERGDVWYRVVFEIMNTNDNGDQGLFGTLETAWQWGIDSAAKEAKTLRAFPIAWPEYDEDADDYVTKVSLIETAPIVDAAIEQFRLIAPIDPAHL